MNNNVIEYLMICRKNSLGFIDFMRGKYSVHNRDYILNMCKQMTNQEKTDLKTKTFNELWKGIWGNESISVQYKMEENISKEKFSVISYGVYSKGEFYNLDMIIEESNQYECWENPEWGFPKGRRNYQEKDFDCAIREFTEETGYDSRNLKKINNLLPFDEIFTGSNYKSYKHKYYLCFMEFSKTLIKADFDSSEVSQSGWKTYEQCMELIRSYNLEKKNLITNIQTILQTYKLIFS
jgi:ADP-ribose pyrophosphatase YjhB (NUDIX family)